MKCRNGDFDGRRKKKKKTHKEKKKKKVFNSFLSKTTKIKKTPFNSHQSQQGKGGDLFFFNFFSKINCSLQGSNL